MGRNTAALPEMQPNESVLNDYDKIIDILKSKRNRPITKCWTEAPTVLIEMDALLAGARSTLPLSEQEMDLDTSTLEAVIGVIRIFGFGDIVQQLVSGNVRGALESSTRCGGLLGTSLAFAELREDAHFLRCVLAHRQVAWGVDCEYFWIQNSSSIM